MKSRFAIKIGWIPVLLLSLAVMLISGCGRSGKDQTGSAAETKTEAPAAMTAAPPAAEQYAGWVEYVSEPHRFAIMTPKSFDVSRDKTQTEAGEIELVTYMAEFDTGAYGVVCSDWEADFLEGKDPNVLLKGGSKGFILNLKGTLTGERLLTLDGHPGLEITLTGVTQGVDILAKGRFYLVGTRQYQIIVIAEKGKEDLAAIDKFLTSFKLR